MVAMAQRNPFRSVASWADTGFATRFLTAEFSVCQWRESLAPKVMAEQSDADVFIPLPGERTLWIALSSEWLWDRYGDFSEIETDGLFGEPPAECEEEDCHYEPETWSDLFVHDERHHRPDEEREAALEAE